MKCALCGHKIHIWEDRRNNVVLNPNGLRAKGKVHLSCAKYYLKHKIDGLIKQLDEAIK
jgi:hypothetical protein